MKPITHIIFNENIFNYSTNPNSDVQKLQKRINLSTVRK